MAIKLCYAGVGDYWEDVDQYIRNWFIDTQSLPPGEGVVANASHAGLSDSPLDFERDPARRTEWMGIGGWGIVCCTGNMTQALYYAWDGIVKYNNGVAQVNLLLNRASPWLDVTSYLPYEGKVVLKNKTASKVFVRIPRWVDKNAVKCRKNSEDVKPIWLCNYLIFEGIGERDSITVEFPMVEETAEFTFWDTTHTFHFKGNDIVSGSKSPEGKSPWSLSSWRERYALSKAPMKKVTHYASPILIEW